MINTPWIILMAFLNSSVNITKGHGEISERTIPSLCTSFSVKWWSYLYF